VHHELIQKIEFKRTTRTIEKTLSLQLVTIR